MASLITHPMAIPVLLPMLAGLLCLLIPNPASRLRGWLAVLATVVVMELRFLKPKRLLDQRAMKPKNWEVSRWQSPMAVANVDKLQAYR